MATRNQWGREVGEAPGTQGRAQEVVRARTGTQDSFLRWQEEHGTQARGVEACVPASGMGPSVHSTAMLSQLASPPPQRGLAELHRNGLLEEYHVLAKHTENVGSAGRECTAERSEHLLLLHFNKGRRSCNVPLKVDF